MKLCQKHQIHFVSDEIYALSVWENPEAPEATGFTSALSIDLDGIIDAHLVHVLWGLSKDFGANGLRIGVIINQGSPEFRLTVNTLNLFGYPSSASDHIATLLLEDDAFTDYYIATNRARIAKSYHTATAFLRRHGIPYAPGVNAAFFLWVDLLSVVKEKRPDLAAAVLVEKLKAEMDKGKVWITDGDNFGAEETGWFRIVFTHPEVYLVEGLRRVVKAVNSVAGSPAEPQAKL
jgi:aspartate/methionine/tyrosine aminotransferase